MGVTCGAKRPFLRWRRDWHEGNGHKLTFRPTRGLRVGRNLRFEGRTVRADAVVVGMEAFGPHGCMRVGPNLRFERRKGFVGALA